jgi:hypothetical protein
MNKMRISLTEKNGEIRGKIEFSGDGLFMLESLAQVIESLAKNRGIPPRELLNDLKGVVK